MAGNLGTKPKESTHAHARTHTHTHVRTRTHTRTCTRTHAHTHTRTHAHTHTHTRAHTRARARTWVGGVERLDACARGSCVSRSSIPSACSSQVCNPIRSTCWEWGQRQVRRSACVCLCMCEAEVAPLQPKLMDSKRNKSGLVQHGDVITHASFLA